jgi:hypothetical protein
MSQAVSMSTPKALSIEVRAGDGCQALKGVEKRQAELGPWSSG